IYLIGIIQAIKENKIIQITHHSFWESQSFAFEIMPYCLKLFKQRWYLLAQNVTFDELRIYGLDRIEHMEITDKIFRYPEDFDAEDYFGTAYGVIQNDDTMPEIVRLKVRNNQTVYFRTLPLHHSQKEVEINKDYSIFEYYLKPTYDFKQEILSNGYNVEVLEPLWLREEMIEFIEKMMINYK
ncbi:MAG: WYL domain-containing protein, partial [Prevotella sp.]|nr:WYL domain-containing protein [Prevotella sp.]